MTKFYRVFALFIVIIIAQTSFSNESLSPVSKSLNPLQLEIVMMSISREQRAVYEEMITAFKISAPDINVTVRVHEYEQFKSNMVSYEDISSALGDVFFWFGGSRLQELANKGLIADLSSLWVQRGWSEKFSEVAERAVTAENRIYAIPLNYSQWGIYYHRSVFEKYNLVEIEVWADLIHACEELSKQGGALFSIGSKSSQSVSGWFDYLNLRINGLSFHNRLIQGDVSYNSTPVYNVFRYWQDAIDSGCFLNGRHEITWKESLSDLYEYNASAVFLKDAFISDAPSNIQKDIGFVPFPMIDRDIPRYEYDAVDALIVSKQSESKLTVKRFLDFIEPSFKPINGLDDIHFDAEQWPYGQGVAASFGQSSPSEMSIPAMDLMAKFLNQELTIDEVLYSLELYRRHVFKK